MPTSEPKYPAVFPVLLFCLSLVLVGIVLGGSFYLVRLLPDPNRFDKAADKETEPGWKAEARITETIAVVRLGQFTMGMLIGVFLLCIGTYLSWVGVREKIGAEIASGDKLKASLSALGPGMVLAVCGTLIVSVCLLKDFRYSEKGGWQGAQPQTPSPQRPDP
jgi:hypothetical protein